MGKKIKVNDNKEVIEKRCHKLNDKEINKLAENYLTVDQVRQLLQYKSNQTIRNLAHKRILNVIKISGKLLFEKRDVLKRIKQYRS